MADKTEQWLLDGKCNLCRKQNYCSKPCTRNKRKTKALMCGMVTSMLDEVTGGAYSAIMERANERYM